MRSIIDVVTNQTDQTQRQCIWFIIEDHKWSLCVKIKRYGYLVRNSLKKIK